MPGIGSLCLEKAVPQAWPCGVLAVQSSPRASPDHQPRAPFATFSRWAPGALTFLVSLAASSGVGSLQLPERMHGGG